MKRLIPFFLVTLAAAQARQSPGHPFEPALIVASIDSFVIVTKVTSGGWRPVGGLIQTVARDSAAIRMSVDYAFPDSKQRVEVAMDAKTLAPLAHWETLSSRGKGDTHGEVMFREGRARGAFILSKRVFDVAIDTGIVDNDASTALLSTLPLEINRTFTFRGFVSPGQMEVTRVHVASIDTVTVPAGRFPSYRLLVMARDTSNVFISRSSPRRVVLVRLGDGSQEMRLISSRR
jgi:hypothetical protein